MYIPAWPTLSPRYLFRSDRGAALPFPLNAGTATSFYTARNGIYHLLRVLGFHDGATILVPDYHHGVEVQGHTVRARSIGYPASADDAKVTPDLVRFGPDIEPVVKLNSYMAAVAQVVDSLGTLGRFGRRKN